jgi:hypothetical protein
MTVKKTDNRPAVNEERLKREAEALRANLAKRKQQQKTRPQPQHDSDAKGESGA